MRGLPAAARSSGISIPWSTEFLTKCTSGSASASTRFLSKSVSSPTSSRVISFFKLLARSRTTRGKRPNTFLIGCMRVFITAPCKSPVTTSKLAMALDMLSSLLLIPKLISLFLTSTSSPTMFIIWSRRLVSTRTVVSAGGAAGAAFFSSFLGAAFGAAGVLALAGAAALGAGVAFGAAGAACFAF